MYPMLKKKSRKRLPKFVVIFLSTTTWLTWCPNYLYDLKEETFSFHMIPKTVMIIQLLIKILNI